MQITGNKYSAGNAVPIATRDHRCPGSPGNGLRVMRSVSGMATRSGAYHGDAEKSRQWNGVRTARRPMRESSGKGTEYLRAHWPVCLAKQPKAISWEGKGEAVGI